MRMRGLRPPSHLVLHAASGSGAERADAAHTDPGPLVDLPLHVPVRDARLPAAQQSVDRGRAHHADAAFESDAGRLADGDLHGRLHGPAAAGWRARRAHRGARGLRCDRRGYIHRDDRNATRADAAVGHGVVRGAAARAGADGCGAITGVPGGRRDLGGVVPGEPLELRQRPKRERHEPRHCDHGAADRRSDGGVRLAGCAPLDRAADRVADRGLGLVRPQHAERAPQGDAGRTR